MLSNFWQRRKRTGKKGRGGQSRHNTAQGGRRRTGDARTLRAARCLRTRTHCTHIQRKRGMLARRVTEQATWRAAHCIVPLSDGIFFTCLACGAWLAPMVTQSTSK